MTERDRTGAGGPQTPAPAPAPQAAPQAPLPPDALCVLNRYDLIGAPDAFVGAVTALAARVQAEGHPGVLGYRFYVNAADRTARAVIDYADAAAWIGHHDIAMPWPEMRAMHGVARLAEVTFLGPVPPEIDAWLAGSSLTARTLQGYLPAAGFRR